MEELKCKWCGHVSLTLEAYDWHMGHVWHVMSRRQERSAPEDEVYRLRVLLQQARDLIKDGWEYTAPADNVGMRLVAEIDGVLGKE